MSIGYAYHCDGPECEAHCAPVATPPPYLPYGFVEVRQSRAGGGNEAHHFCGWNCLMKYAAAKPVSERIDIDGGDLNA